MAQRWRIEDPGCPWPITAELWTRGDRKRMMELSIKAPALLAAVAVGGFMAFLAEVGAERDKSQQAKTRWALDYYVGKLAGPAASKAAAGKKAPSRKPPTTRAQSVPRLTACCVEGSGGGGCAQCRHSRDTDLHQEKCRMRKFPELNVLRVALTTVGAGAWLLAIAPPAFADGTGWFTQAQVDRGRWEYAAKCTACHGAKLQGTGAPPLKGPEFVAQWNDKTLEGPLLLRA